ncbi:rod shape-determining protein [Streptomyces sp. URMC 123]|uniref:rod shape-determining protein n=1 Tax=Streptomyces sp. URMC 123 TaxID=3423403 RepID=UPI003F1BD9E7
MTAPFDQLRRCSVAVDLGAARTRVYVKHRGLLVDEPSVAAVNKRTGALVAVGEAAEAMAGRTPEHIRVVRPVVNGTVVDIDVAHRMLRHLLAGELRRAWRRRPTLRIAACARHDSEPLVQRATVETLTALGARRVELADTLLCAAVGSGLPVERAEATMVVVCGTATTHVAVLSLGAVVAAHAIPVGGDSVDRAVVEHLRRHHELMLPSQAGRPLDLVLAAADRMADRAEVHGRDVATGVARSVIVDGDTVRQAIDAPLTAVLDGLRTVLRGCPPDLVADLCERGITLTGGNARLPGLETMLARATGMRVTTADRPDLCAILGLGAILEGRVQHLPDLLGV